MKEKDLYNPNKWTAFIIYTDLEMQQRIIRRLRAFIEKFDHYNFNFYGDHISIRVYGKGKKQLEKKIYKHFKGKIDKCTLKPYSCKGRKNYEIATRCAFMIWGNKQYYEQGNSLNMVELLHGIIDNLSDMIPFIEIKKDIYEMDKLLVKINEWTHKVYVESLGFSSEQNFSFEDTEDQGKCKTSDTEGIA